jgi:Leucine-rich repeat (LRR) protein
MLRKETYYGWDWEKIWKHKEGSYSILSNIEAINQVPFELTYRMLTYSSVIIEWPDIQGAKEYDISYLDKMENSIISQALIENLTPGTEYEFKVRAKIGDSIRVWSRALKVKTKKLLIDGLHTIGKDLDAITLTWNPADDAESYEVIYNNEIMRTQKNTCRITGLYSDIPYVIHIKALISDGSNKMSNPIMEKIYTLNPQTDYAKEFVDKCEGQTWFMDEIENILNLKGKSINTINSKQDFSTIYAITLTDRNISGKIPRAIGELSQLEYLYLGNNNLSEKLPAELDLLDKLIKKDLSGNHFTN